MASDLQTDLPERIAIYNAFIGNKQRLPVRVFSFSLVSEFFLSKTSVGEMRCGPSQKQSDGRSQSWAKTTRLFFDEWVGLVLSRWWAAPATRAKEQARDRTEPLFTSQKRSNPRRR